MDCNCNNIGSTCGGCRACGRNGGTTLAVFQQGDAFPLYVYFDIKDGAEGDLIPEGWDLLAAIYDHKGDCVATYTTADGGIKPAYNCYKIKVSHEVSVRLCDNAVLELTLINSNTGAVDHADRAVTMVFEPRRNNEFIKLNKHD